MQLRKKCVSFMKDYDLAMTKHPDISCDNFFCWPLDEYKAVSAGGFRCDKVGEVNL
jgi:hypothetical protein